MHHKENKIDWKKIWKKKKENFFTVRNFVLVIRIDRPISTAMFVLVKHDQCRNHRNMRHHQWARLEPCLVNVFEDVQNHRSFLLGAFRWLKNYSPRKKKMKNYFHRFRFESLLSVHPTVNHRTLNVSYRQTTIHEKFSWLMVKQEPQTKSTKLINEWKRNARTEAKNECAHGRNTYAQCRDDGDE